MKQRKKAAYIVTRSELFFASTVAFLTEQESGYLTRRQCHDRISQNLRTHGFEDASIQFKILCFCRMEVLGRQSTSSVAVVQWEGW